MRVLKVACLKSSTACDIPVSKRTNLRACCLSCNLTSSLVILVRCIWHPSYATAQCWVFKRKHPTWRVFRGKAERQNRRCTQCTQLSKPAASNTRHRLAKPSMSKNSTLTKANKLLLMKSSWLQAKVTPRLAHQPSKARP